MHTQCILMWCIYFTVFFTLDYVRLLANQPYKVIALERCFEASYFLQFIVIEELTQPKWFASKRAKIAYYICRSEHTCTTEYQKMSAVAALPMAWMVLFSTHHFWNRNDNIYSTNIDFFCRNILILSTYKMKMLSSNGALQYWKT